MHDRTLDAVGLLCPLPVLRARKLLEEMAVGEVLLLLASDSMAQVDVPAFCREAGHEFLGMEEHDNAQSYSIRKGSKASNS